MTTINKAIKHDKGKAKLSLLPYDALAEVSKAMDFGASKYGKHNYKQGMEYSRLIDAALRHLNQYAAGIDLDDESNLNHLSHCVSNLLMLLWMVKNKPEMDDR